MLSLLVLSCFAAIIQAVPRVIDSRSNVTYIGQTRNTLDAFLGIRYGEDTSGQYRFQPPRPHTPANNSTVNAQSYGPACMQPTNSFLPLVLSNFSHVSEDCLNLNIIRPNDTVPGSKLPVMFWIHGGSFWEGANQEITTQPDGMILESIANKLPVMHVATNYRLGAFGFAQSTALRRNKSENAGLRDQRLAIEWAKDNIAQFGGDPEKITIFGQSSGGLAIGMQILAYGGSQPVPFQQGICESQALEPGITGNITKDQMQLLADATGCNTSDINSDATIACLRALDTDTFANASFNTYSADIAHNIGDSWLPVVDGDFLPAAPSELLAQGRMANVTTTILWCNNDVQFFTPMDITTPQDTLQFVHTYLPAITNQSAMDLLALYPSSDFQGNKTANLTAEFYRSAQIFRDLLMTCQPIHFGESLAKLGNVVYYANQNQSILPSILESLGVLGLGPVHTSEFAYTMANFSHYDGWPYHVDANDYRIQKQQSRSWSTFAATGQLSLYAKDTLQSWEPAYAVQNETQIFVVGGDSEGLTAIDGAGATSAMEAQKLRSRCGFINSAGFIPQMQY